MDWAELAHVSAYLNAGLLRSASEPRPRKLATKSWQSISYDKTKKPGVHFGVASGDRLLARGGSGKRPLPDREVSAALRLCVVEVRHDVHLRPWGR